MILFKLYIVITNINLQLVRCLRLATNLHIFLVKVGVQLRKYEILVYKRCLFTIIGDIDCADINN